MDFLKLISKPAARVSGGTSAVLCFSAAAGFWVAGQHNRAICWIVLGVLEIGAIVL